MAFKVSRLRFWFALGAVLVTATAAGAYFYAKWRVETVLKNVPGKISIDVQQSAEGFTVSHSEGGRTIFKIQASKVVQYKAGGRAELHNVNILLYGRDSTRYDQIYGDDFEYDPKSGDVVANGEVQIDLEANPAGILNPDQTVPRELKNPVHLKTSGLVFNQKTGNAFTKEKVEFAIPQARGSAVGVSYTSKSNVLTLESKINIVFNGATSASIVAVHATITKDPQLVTLEKVELQGPSQHSQADRVLMFLRPDYKVDRILASGNLNVETQGRQPGHMQAEQLTLWMNDADTLRSGIFSGNVRVETTGTEAMQGSAGKVLLNFAGKNQLASVRMEENVKLSQRQKTSAKSSYAQNMEITAPQLDFIVAGGRLKGAQTSGPPQLAIRSESSNAGQTVVTAGKFEAQFDDFGRLASVHGAPDARIVNSNPGQPDRVSTSDSLDAAFSLGTGMEAILQQGHVAYTDGGRKAWAERARYTPADQIIVLTGSPRVVDGGMTTTARTMRLNRATGDAFAEGDVKSTYSDLKPQPDGALLASADPIHVTARAMTAHRTSAIALYSGGARLWQNANIIEAPSIEFDRTQRSVTALATSTQNVSTVLIQTGSSGKVMPVTVTAGRMTYADKDRKIHLEANVVTKSADVTVTSGQMDIFLHSQTQNVSVSSIAGAGKVERIVAQNNVVITQPTRRAVGEQLVYTAAEDKFVLTGGPPSIFDAERGKITGVSLTFFRHDDRVLIEGNDTSPTITHTRVAR